MARMAVILADSPSRLTTRLGVDGTGVAFVGTSLMGLDSGDCGDNFFPAKKS